MSSKSKQRSDPSRGVAMRASASLSTLLVLTACCLPAFASAAEDWSTLGHRQATSIVPTRDPCSGALSANHDWSFESAYAWESHGAWPEYYGAWGEAYDLGSCEVICGAYWLTTTPEYYEGQPSSLYLWEGGVTGEPGTVLFVLPDVVFPSIPFWPTFGQNDVAIGCVVEGEFTIGFWGNWGPPFSQADFWIAVDEDEPGGHPWTYVAPGMGFDPGWHPVSDITPFHECRSLGIGVYHDDPPTPVRETSWSHVKGLYR